MLALIATDGSPAAIAAAHDAVSLLHPDMELDIVSVIPYPEDPMDVAGGIEGPVVSQEEADAEERAAVAVGRSALDRTRTGLGVPLVVELERGDNPGATVCALAAERAADVLVVGGSEKGWFSRLVHGSVMEYAAHHSPCPVARKSVV